MKISCCWLYAIQHYGYSPSIKDTFRVLEDIANMGFDYVEIEAFNIKEENVRSLWDHRDELKRRVAGLGLEIINYPIMLPGLLSPDDIVRKENLELFDIGVETAGYLGIKMLQLDSFAPSLEFIGESPYQDGLAYDRHFKVRVRQDYSWEKEWDILVKTFRYCCEKLKRSGIKMIVEPRVGEKIANTDSLLRLMDQVNNANLGAVLDTAHLHAQKEIIPLSVEKLGKRIFYVHAADNDGRSNVHNNIGEGTIDWEGTLLALKKYDYDGYISIDVKPENIRDIDREYIESKKYLEKIAEKIDFKKNNSE